jgi:hypothetical protein
MGQRYQSGEVVPVSGIYQVKGINLPSGLMQGITFIRGRRFPTYSEARAVTFELVYRDEGRSRRRHRR